MGERRKADDVTPGVDSANKEAKSSRGGAASGRDSGEFIHNRELETTEAKSSSSSPLTPRRTKQPLENRNWRADDPPSNGERNSPMKPDAVDENGAEELRNDPVANLAKAEKTWVTQ